jgi:YHS domain-containing protein
MKKSLLHPLLLTLAMLSQAVASNPGDAKPYPLKTCVVSGDKLSEISKPLTFNYEGQEVKLCCRDCKRSFDKNPAKYLAKIQAANSK